MCERQSLLKHVNKKCMIAIEWVGGMDGVGGQVCTGLTTIFTTLVDQDHSPVSTSSTSVVSRVSEAISIE